jgi:para-nitrobenzyl esterase
VAPLLALLCAVSGACESDIDKLNDDLQGPGGDGGVLDSGASSVTGGDAGTGSGIVDGKPRVTIDDGVLEGATEDNKVHSFLGIPYAKPPIGDLRWKLPQKNEKWSSVRDASKFGGRCAQLASSTLMNPASDTEDCLYLNVWTPSFTPAAPLPVMFWIHGGGNQNGSASEAVPYANTGYFYSGKFLAAKDVVVVTFNYRLGAFGFLAHPAIATETGGAAGNQGLYDQALALEWVKSNITKFGGDPKKVTIFGESAGSLDVCYHMTSPKTRDLFHGAISESGGCTTKQKTVAEGQTESSGRLATALGCAAADVACLRGKTVAEILNVPASTATVPAPAYTAVIEGPNGFLSDQPRKQFDTGNVAKVPYMLGSNTDEGTLFVLFTAIADEAALIAQLAKDFPGADPTPILAAYPSDKFPGDTAQKDRYARIVGDARLVCSTYDSAIRASAATSGIPAVWTYNFDMPVSIPTMPGLKLGATHGAELASVFGTSPSFAADAMYPMPEGKMVSDRMMNYWTNFAKKGDPNGGSELAWPKFSASMNQRMNFALQATVASDFRKPQCELWMAGYDKSFAAAP